MLLLGLTGSKRAGKDTVAEFLHHNYGFSHYAVAGPLKECVCGAFQLTASQVHGDAKEEIDPRWGVSPRKLLQIIGTEFGRDLLPQVIPELNLNGESLWVRHLRFFLKRAQATPGVRVVVSDVRFEDEARVIREFGGQVVRIERPALHTDVDADDDAKHDPHSSEAGLAHVDHVLCNDGTVHDLHTKVKVWWAKQRRASIKTRQPTPFVRPALSS